jgi:hypothetical protein
MCHRLEGSIGWLSQRRDGAYTDEDAVLATGCSIVVVYQLALKWPRLEMKNSGHRSSELSACCSTAMLMMSFSCWYTLLTLSMEGMGRVSKSAAVAAMLWIALGKVGCGVPSWLMAMTMALA